MRMQRATSSCLRDEGREIVWPLVLRRGSEVRRGVVPARSLWEANGCPTMPGTGHSVPPTATSVVADIYGVACV